MAEDPYTIRHRLAAKLRDARLERRMTQLDVAIMTTWSVSKVNRYEKGRRPPILADLKLLLPMLGVPENEMEEWLDLARRARMKSSSQEFADILTASQLEFFEAVTKVDLYQEASDIIPLLLRTDQYCLAIDRAFQPADRIDRWQEFNEFVRSTPPTDRTRRLVFMLGESCLWRMVGGVEVMHEQLSYLWILNRHPNVSIRIVPFDVGMHVGLITGFSLLTNVAEKTAFAAHRHLNEPCFMERRADRVTQLQRDFDELALVSVSLESMLPQAFARLAA